MEQCEYYETVTYSYLDRHSHTVKQEKEARCTGTKNREICNCGGDRRFCNYYERVIPTMTKSEAEAKFNIKIVG